MKFIIIFLCAFLACSSSAGNAEVTAIVGATVIDGNGGPPIQDGVILVEGDRIEAVGPNTMRIPSRARKVDASGKFVIPGLMDANVHLVYGFSTEYLLRFEREFNDIIAEGAQVALKNGITTLFDTWGPLDPLTQVRDGIARGDLPGSRIFVAGNIVGLDGPFSNDFYASTQSVGEATVRRINGLYEQGVGQALVYMSPDEVRVAIRAYVAKKIDFLKFAVSGHGDATLGFLLFSPEVQQIIIAEARKRGFVVETHTTTVESLRMAVEAGVDLMQHCDLTTRNLIPPDLIAEIAARKIPCGMQIFPHRFLKNLVDSAPGGDPTKIEDPTRRLFAIGMRNRENLIRSGVTVLMATDGGVAYRGDPLLNAIFHRQSYPGIDEDIVGFFGKGHLAWLRGARDAGLSPMQTLQAATRNIAAAYKKLADLGTIEKGKLADMVVLNADPLSDPANYGSIHLVMKNGKIVDRAALPLRPILSANK